ncbi:MAG: hypothetical protein ACKO04_00585 [Actinomycetes bacterium]
MASPAAPSRSSLGRRSAASHRQRSAIGYQRTEGGPIVLNPPKSADPGLGPDDMLLVVRQSGVVPATD